MQQLDYNHTMSDIIEDLTTRIANLDPINSSSFKETLLILLAVVATPDINQQKQFDYIFQGLYNFSKQLLIFK